MGKTMMINSSRTVVAAAACSKNVMIPSATRCAARLPSPWLVMATQTSVSARRVLQAHDAARGDVCRIHQACHVR